MTTWTITYDPFDPGPRRLPSDGYALFLIAHNDDDIVMAQAEISGQALRVDLADVGFDWKWPAVAKCAARDLAILVRDGARTEGAAALRIPVAGPDARQAVGSDLVALGPGATIGRFES